MYVLKQKDLNLWQVHTSSGAAEGTLYSIVELMVVRLGFSLKDVTEGIEMMIENTAQGDDTIHFGIWKSPIFTENSKNKEKAS